MPSYYKKQVEIAREFGVSEGTVTNWIKGAEEGKNNLQIEITNGKSRIVDNEHNEAEMTRLASEGKKHRSNLNFKRTQADKLLYEIFSEEEISEMINDLEFKKQINLKFCYKNIGTKYWDEFYMSNSSPIRKEVSQRIINIVHESLNIQKTNSKVNIIDIGPGNGYPVKDVLKELLESKSLHKYIPIDFSNEMSDLACNNVKEWFPEINIKKYVLDIEASRFSKIFLENKSFSENISNIVLYLDGLCNHDDTVQVLKNFRKGLTFNDLIVLGFTLDTKNNRSKLNYIRTEMLDNIHSWILRLLGIDMDECDMSARYDSDINSKVKYVKLDKDYETSIDLFGEKKKLTFQSGEEINVWKHFLFNVQDFISILNEADLEIINLQIDKNYSYAMVICQAKQNT
jgi:uncharacterized SAM-dependent methyltransferase